MESSGIDQKDSHQSEYDLSLGIFKLCRLNLRLWRFPRPSLMRLAKATNYSVRISPLIAASNGQ
jgi:hypothetical protein